MARYRKRPVEVEAMQWTGDNGDELLSWTDGGFYVLDPEDGAWCGNPEATGALYVGANSTELPIETGEWVIHDSKGFYPCKADVFTETYEPVSED